ncbi:MAG: hypothetical protein AMJ81_06880 [Phycisphaerae bacterium SM23_33]|nr:MAG: hypothetical protein AMJ81_06880 [Phycisphaerae bacterium SM23_33]
MGGQQAPEVGQWLESLMRRHERPLTRYAARITGDVERARDVVQETFLRLLSANHPGDDHLAQWLFTVCRNRALDVARKEHRMSPLTEAQARSQSSREAAPPAAAQRRETLGRTLQALQALPPNQQEVVRLKFQNGFSYRQIAAITGLSASNVGFLIHTAIRTIRQKLQAATGPAGGA